MGACFTKPSAASVPALHFGLDIRPGGATGGEPYQPMIYQIGNFCDNLWRPKKVQTGPYTGTDIFSAVSRARPVGGSSRPDVARADDDPFVGGQLAQPHRPARMQALGGDGHLGP